jgi:hypothetical protein
MLVFVVAKKTRDDLNVFSGRALRAGIAMAGAEARSLLACSAARLKPCPDTKPGAFRDLTVWMIDHFLACTSC